MHVKTRYLRGGDNDVVEGLLPEPRRCADGVADAHENAGVWRRQVEMVDEEAVVLESAERQTDRHERDRTRILSAVDEAVCRHHAGRDDRTCRHVTQIKAMPL